MRVGVSTACFYPLLTEESLRLVGESGADCTEIFFNAAEELQPPFVKMLDEMRRGYGLPVVSIHPAYSLDESYMLFSAYDRRLRQGLAEFCRYGEIAATLGAKYVILHGGKNNGILNDEGYCERYLMIADAVKKGGATLLHENVRGFRAGNLEFLKTMKSYLGEKIEFCMDVKQCLRNGYTPFEMVEAVGRNIRHLHISDHSAEKDCLLPGKGNFNFNRLFQELQSLGYSGDAVVEVYENAYARPDEIFAAADLIK